MGTAQPQGAAERRVHHAGQHPGSALCPGCAAVGRCQPCGERDRRAAGGPAPEPAAATAGCGRSRHRWRTDCRRRRSAVCKPWGSVRLRARAFFASRCRTLTRHPSRRRVRLRATQRRPCATQRSGTARPALKVASPPLRLEPSPTIALRFLQGQSSARDRPGQPRCVERRG